MTSPTRSSWRAFATMALVAFSAMVYEVLLTRIASAILLYHFAFLALSLAMLGIGAPGVWLFFWPPRKTTLANALLLAGLSMPLSVIAVFKLGAYLPIGQTGGSELPLLVASCSLLPLLALGTATCILLMQIEPQRVGLMYGVDLLGASLGAFTVIPWMFVTDAPHIMALVGLMPLAGAALVSDSRRVPAFLLALALLGSVVWRQPYQLRFNRHAKENTAPLYEKWSPTGRITVVPEARAPKGYVNSAFGWGWGRNRPRTVASQLWVQQEGGAGTPIMQLEHGPRALDYLNYDVTSVAYQLMPPKRACVIGAGGGRDVLIALNSGAADVDAVELNPAIVRAVSGPFRRFSGDPYHLPGVHGFVSEGRSFLTRSKGNYDAIQIAMVDSYAATAAGAYALSESYLYTVEAFRLYWNRLASDGFVAVSRWHRPEREIETTRMVLMIAEALRRERVDEPLTHVAVVRGGGVATIIVTRRALSSERYERLEQIDRTRGFDRLWPPHPATASSQTTQILLDPAAEQHARGIDLTPPTDDRPFFFQTTQIFVDRYTDTGQAIGLVRTLSGWLLLLCGFLFFLPLALKRAVIERGSLLHGSAYFTAIGLAFMFVEAPLIQWFVLFLGHPSYATTVVIAALLLGAGIGSQLSARCGLDPIRRYRLVLPCVLALELLAVPRAAALAMGFCLLARAAIAVAMLLPAGLVMGFAFPAGMTLYGERNKPWFWAVNGAASVMGSVLSLACALVAGFMVTISCGVVGYVLACVLLGNSRGRGVEPAPNGTGNQRGTRPA